MYLGTYHGVPLVNGYSGFFPQSYFDLREMVNTRFPEETVFDRLRERKVAFVVVDSAAYSPDVIERLDSSQKLERAFRSSSGTIVYRIVEIPDVPEP
jgi:hypothetical protein